MILYHGSPEVVEHPDIKRCYPHNDYGTGFYCTLEKDLALEWACNRPGRNGFCNTYDLDDRNLVTLDLDEHPNGVLAWLAVLFSNRIFDAEWNIEHDKNAFIKKYDVNLSSADIVCGYRADNSYFSIARSFVSGAITDEQAAEALQLGHLGRQVALMSRKSFRALHFIEYEEAPSSVWYPRYIRRDKEARLAFQDLLGSKHATGKRIHELIGG